MAQLAEARTVIVRQLGETVLSIHLFGSALQGGLKPSSDVDLFVTVTAPPDATTRHALMTDLLSVSAPPGTHDTRRALEVTVVARDQVVPWRYPARREMQFGEWLRADIEAGRFEPPVVDHDLALLMRQVMAHGDSLIGPAPHEVFEPVPDADIAAALRTTLDQWNTPEDWAGDERNIVLALARIWYTAETGAIAAKDEAAEWLVERLPVAHRNIISAARAAYVGDRDAEASLHAEAVAAFIAHARAAIGDLLEQRDAR